MEKRLEQEIRNYFDAEVRQVEPPRDILAGVMSRLEKQKRPDWRFGFIPQTRLAWAIAILVILLLSGTAYAATRVVNQLFSKFAGHVEEAGLVQELNLSQTIDGVTVRLERAYADAGVVLVGFTVSGPDERYFTPGGTLSTSDGQNLLRMFGMGVVPGSETIMGGWNPSERTAMIVAFDASSIKEVLSELNLRLEIQVARSAVPGNSQGSIGPFIFDFSVPFHAKKVISMEQTVEAAGIPITLERVEITPWATKAVFRFYPPYDNSDSRSPIFSLKLPNGDLKENDFGQVSGPSSPEYQEYFTGDFTGQHGEWTIVISELVLPSTGGERIEISPGAFIVKGGQPNRLSGPWVFHFEVP